MARYLVTSTAQSLSTARNDNVAIVWSPNQVSAWGIEADDFYPGDEYVD